MLKPGHAWGTLIIRAAAQSPGGVIDTLVRAGADVDAIDDAIDRRRQHDRLHALHEAAFRGNRDAVVALLDHGASVRKRDSKYCGTPAGWANYARHPELRDLILAKDIDVFDAIDFAPQRISDIVRREPASLERPIGALLDSPPKPDGWIKPWWTPLAYAVARGNADAARTLLDLGADAHTHDPEGKTLAALVGDSTDESMRTAFADS